VEFFDRHVEEGLEAVERVLREDFGSPSWIEVEVGWGSAQHIFGPHPT
jgi:hypothetical protein